MKNLGSVVKFTASLTDPQSKPGCWAYPDMRKFVPHLLSLACICSCRIFCDSGCTGVFAVEVGHLATPAEDRSHFGAWCIVSSPLWLQVHSALLDCNSTFILPADHLGALHSGVVASSTFRR